MTMPRPHALIRPHRIDLDTAAYQSGVHPELLRRFVALGVVEASTDPSGRLWFESGVRHTVARIERLRAGLCLNYAAIGLVLDLLDRIDALETAIRTGASVPQQNRRR
jgi:hypothetical protein